METLPLSVFRATLERRVRWMHRTLRTANADLPGLLFVATDRDEVLLAGRFDVIGLTSEAKTGLATRTLPEVICSREGRRAGWLMPAWQHTDEAPIEALALVVAEPHGAEAVIAPVIRRSTGPPLLGRWSDPTVLVSGLFVDPLLDALRSVKGNIVDNSDALPRPRLLASCPDCGAAVSEPHERGCDVERCSACEEQWLLCQCPDHEPLLEVWTGQWPGAAVCRALGWYALWHDRSGWLPCRPRAPGAIEDLNRLAVYRQFGRDCLYD
jgi:hypothetical protein